MYCSRLLVAVIVLCGCFVSTVVGFVHRIDQTFTKDRSSFQISDGYMYASKKGPFLMPKGSSTIHFAADILSK